MGFKALFLPLIPVTRRVASRKASYCTGKHPGPRSKCPSPQAPLMTFQFDMLTVLDMKSCVKYPPTLPPCVMQTAQCS